MSTARTSEKLDVFHQRCPQKILRIDRSDHVINEVSRRAKAHQLFGTVTKRRLRLAGHIQHQEKDRVHTWCRTCIKDQGLPFYIFHRTLIAQDGGPAQVNVEGFYSVLRALTAIGMLPEHRRRYLSTEGAEPVPRSKNAEWQDAEQPPNKINGESLLLHALGGGRETKLK